MARRPDPAQPLACPNCASTFGLDERFCSTCQVPLVYGAAPAVADPITDRQQRARKIKPQLAEGELVRVVGAQNQVEAEFIQGMLLEEGVPSLLRRSAGFDVPDFLAAGPRDILVPAAGVATAREVLLQAELIDPQATGRAVAPKLLATGLLAALMLGAVVVWLVSQVAH